MKRPLPDVKPNTWEFLRDAMITPTGFREYDARWKYPDEINLPGMTALGLGLGTQMWRRKIAPMIIIGNDYRDCSLAIKQALTLGLIRAGIAVRDIGPALSPMAYFAQAILNAPAVAMVTASHNPNGWTGVKMGFDHPLTHGPEEMAELRDIVLSGEFKERNGGTYGFVEGMREAYIRDIVGNFRMKRRLKVVCATGNGTASAFAPEILRRIGVEVVPSHNNLDYTFPNYNPNPEDMHMLQDMAKAVVASHADLALGFDGDGDRCGVVDDEGMEIFSDKVGVILARDLSRRFPNARFVADIKSTGLFESDPALRSNGATTDYWKTGHSHMKRRVRELGALAGFEKSGHYFLAEPIGRGYDCAMRVTLEICKLMDRNPNQSMSDLHRTLPKVWNSPTMSPHCSDTGKYAVVRRLTEKLVARAKAGGKLAGRRIDRVVTVDGARVFLDNRSWGLVRASSNKPNLVVVCESTESEEELRAIFSELDAVIRTEPEVGEYDQTF